MLIGNKLKQVMAAHGINQRELADGLNVNVNQLNMVLNDKRTMSFELLCKILKHFNNVDCNWLLSENDSRVYIDTGMPTPKQSDFHDSPLEDIQRDLKAIIERLSQI